MNGTDLRPPVVLRPPSTRVMRFVNPAMRFVLRTPFGPRMAPLARLEFRGRRTGKPHVIAVVVHDLDSGPVIFTDRSWRLNFRDGLDVTVRRGRTRQHGTAQLINDPSRVGPALAAAVRQSTPRKLGLDVDPDREPTDVDYGNVGKSMITLRLH